MGKPIRDRAQARRLLEQYPRIVRGMAQLLVYTESEGQWFEVEGVCHIGAGEGCHVRLSSSTCVHLLCTIKCIEGGWSMILESDQTPIKVNGVRSKDCELHSGDLLQLPTWGMLFVENRNDDTGDVPIGSDSPCDDPRVVLT